MISRFNTGSDHRLVRGTLNINFKLERNRMVRQVLRPNLPQAGHEEFQLELKNRFAALETPANVDEDLESIVRAVREMGTKHFREEGLA